MPPLFNRDVFARSPTALVLANQGVAKVDAAQTESELQTLRFELETFVCRGHYQQGMVKVLSAFLRNLDQPEQQAVWVSGFYGSGKSHFLKMLRALWTNEPFADGARPRGLAHLPDDVTDLLTELSNVAKRQGGLHAASGTLSSAAHHKVRVAILSILLRSCGLPVAYERARLVLWLQQRGVLDAVQHNLARSGASWQAELDLMYVSTVLHDALLAALPDLGADRAAVARTIGQQFRESDDVSDDQLISAAREVLKPRSTDGKMPLTLLAVDEIQQFVGGDVDRSMHVQNAVEALCRAMGGRLLVVGSGQAALAGSQLLERLLGRFQVTVALNDTDVASVLREVVLKKRPDAAPTLDAMLETCRGEVDRHLAGSRIAPTAADRATLAADYPLLPVRRRFWEHALRAVGESNASQLRNQLTMTAEAARLTADQPLGTVVGGDFLFDFQAATFAQLSVLSRDVYERILAMRGQGDSGALQARICGVVFLIGKLPHAHGADLGIVANAETLADLLVTDLRTGTAELRRHIEAALASLEAEGVLLNIGSEYRLQTRQSAEWEAEYRSQAAQMEQNPSRIDVLRSDALREAISAMPCLARAFVHGRARVSRPVLAVVGQARPQAADGSLVAWIRDGWTASEDEVIADARGAGQESPTVFGFVPRVHADALRSAIVRWHAATTTLALKAAPTDNEGSEASAAMATRANDGERTAKALIADLLAHARVWSGGGSEVAASDFAGALSAALDTAATRLFPRFAEADHGQWGDALQAARRPGDVSPFDKVGHTGNTESHAVAREVIRYVGTGRRGSEIREHFKAPPYGWPQDAIDAAMIALSVGGQLRATHTATQAAVAMASVPANQIAQHTFRVEQVVVSGAQKIAVARLASAVHAAVSQSDSATTARNIVDALRVCAAKAGGDAPRPDLPNLQRLDDLAALAGNALAVGVANAASELAILHTTWTATAAKIEEREPGWRTIQQLCAASAGLAEAQAARAQVEAVKANRLLLADPDPVPALSDQLTQRLRSQLQAAAAAFKTDHEAGMAALAADASWSKLTPEQKHQLLREHQLLPPVAQSLGTAEEVLAAAAERSVQTWDDKRRGLQSGFADARTAAASLLEPKTQAIKVPPRLLRTEADLDAWLGEVRKDVAGQLANGPVLLQ